jgi:hypothetical protein
MGTRAAVDPLRLPHASKACSEELAEYDGAGLNPFSAMAVADKVSAMTTARVFHERRNRVGWVAFDRIMFRKGGEPPRHGDEVP